MKQTVFFILSLVFLGILNALPYFLTDVYKPGKVRIISSSLRTEDGIPTRLHSQARGLGAVLGDLMEESDNKHTEKTYLVDLGLQFLEQEAPAVKDTQGGLFLNDQKVADVSGRFKTDAEGLLHFNGSIRFLRNLSELSRETSFQYRGHLRLMAFSIVWTLPAEFEVPADLFENNDQR